MAAPRISIGSEFFRKIREENALYIDKTRLIEELFQNNAEVSLITRPRRFGKTLTMTMLQEFFDIQKDSRAIFEGLAIAENKALCDSWMNKYPTVFLTLKGVEGLNFNNALFSCADLIGNICSQHRYLQESPSVAPRDKEALLTLESTKDENLLAGSLILLCRSLHAHYGKPVVLLIDEYDVPLARAQENGYYREMVSFLRNFLGGALKTNPSLSLAVLTGCLRISKESIFTGLNNFRCYGIDHPIFADKIGFTAADVDALLSFAGIAEKKAAVREWYDGYRFGNNVEMYCPWDVLQYVVDAKYNPSAPPKPYWNNSSGNAIVRSFVGRTDLNISDKFEALLAGGCVEARIVEGLTYDSLHSSEDNLWTLLYYTGYLTRASAEQMEKCGILPGGNLTPLAIPNKEVREIFVDSISSWFTDSMLAMDRKPLFDAFWKADADTFRKQLSRILLTTISYHDYHENFYHAVLAGIFVGSGYAVASNRESGRGRPDIIIKDQRNARLAIIEVKHAGRAAELQPLASEAIRQIKSKEYAEPFLGLYEEITLWGMAFYEKRCEVCAEPL